MAKGKYADWLTEEGLICIQGWARAGLTDEQIAKNMGICRDTLIEWKKRYPDISDALKKGKEVVDFEVENALLKKALAGDMTACIYWLNNRKRDTWRAKPEPEKQASAAENNLAEVLESGINRVSGYEI